VNAARALAAVALWGCLAGAWVRAADEPTPLECTVKASCLFRFAQFVQWPESAFASNTAPFVVSVVAPEIWHQPVREALEGRQINDHPIQVRFVSEPAPADPGHLLFVAAPDHRRLASLLEARRAGTLKVGETEAFLAAGGMIAFVVVEGKVRFDVDLGAAEQAGLKLHSSMLAQARRVRGVAKSSGPR
jgi:hypothetical protein